MLNIQARMKFSKIIFPNKIYYQNKKQKNMKKKKLNI